MTSKLETLKLDAAELYRLSELTDRRRVKDILDIEAKRIETEISLLHETEGVVKSSSGPNPSLKRSYDVKITSYAWDLRDSTVKIFVSLPNVETVPTENIRCNFTDTSFELRVEELDNKNYILAVKNLYSHINIEKCSWKVKKGQIILSLPKQSPSHWPTLTKVENEKKKLPKMDEDADPAAGMMNLMKQMYEEGDDDIKRTIAKAWTESREKSQGFGL